MSFYYQVMWGWYCLDKFAAAAAAAAKSLQSCPTLCDPTDGSPPGSPVPGTLQARTLERVAIYFSNAWKWEVKVKLLSCVQLVATPWPAAHQAPPSMGFSRQEYWIGLPLPSPVDKFRVQKLMYFEIQPCLFSMGLNRLRRYKVLKQTSIPRAQWEINLFPHQIAVCF